MDTFKILRYPDPRLQQRSESVDQVTDELRQFADQMLRTMYAHQGIGLSAPQVGRPIRYLCTDTRSLQAPPAGTSANGHPTSVNDSRASANGQSASANDSPASANGHLASVNDSRASANGHPTDPQSEASYSADLQSAAGNKTSRYALPPSTELEGQIPQPLHLFNPVITRHSGHTEFREGCLSLPSYYENVKRYNYIELEALDLQGCKIQLKTDGLLSICIQHEIDHLDGKLFIDRLSFIKASILKSKIQKHGYPTRASSRGQASA